jgi:Tol biopolymer transport system component
MATTTISNEKENRIQLTTKIFFTATTEPTLTSIPTNIAFPKNIGGGGKIAYDHPDPKSGSDLYIYNFDTGKETPYLVGEEIPLSIYSWSANGDQIIFAYNYKIVILDIKENKLRIIYSDQGINIYAPSLSPDEKYIAFVSDNLAPGLFPQIYLMHSDGTNITHLVSLESQDPRWSKDSKSILFWGSKDNNTNYGIYMINIDKTNLTQINNFGEDPIWSPDGKKIVFAGTGDRDFKVFIMNSDGSNLVQLTQDGLCPTWLPDGSTIAYLTDFDQGFGRIHLLDTDGKNNLILPTIKSVGCPEWSK